MDRFFTWNQDVKGDSDNEVMAMLEYFSCCFISRKERYKRMQILINLNIFLYALNVFKLTFGNYIYIFSIDLCTLTQ